MNTKKISILLLILTVMLVFTGCGDKTSTEDSAQKATQTVTSESNDSATKLDTIKSNKKIVLGTAADYPPYEFYSNVDGKLEVVGFDIDIAKAIAADLGVELEIIDMKFEGLLPALSANKIDFIVAGMVPTDERKKSVDFSTQYYNAEQTAVVLTENLDKFKTMADFEGKKLGAQKSTVQEEIAMAVPNAEVKSLAKLTDLIMEVNTQKVDAIMLASPVAKAYAQSNPNLSVPDISFGTEDGVAVAVSNGNEALIAEINKTLTKLIEEGKIDKFIADATMLADNTAE